MPSLYGLLLLLWGRLVCYRVIVYGLAQARLYPHSLRVVYSHCIYQGPSSHGQYYYHLSREEHYWQGDSPSIDWLRFRPSHLD